MRKIILLMLVLAAGCASPYEVREVTDRFSDPGRPAMYAMTSNSIDYHDPVGLAPSSELNGYVERDRNANKVVSVGVNVLVVDHGASGLEQYAATHGTPRWLRIRAGDEIEFLADGERVAVAAQAVRFDHRVTNLGAQGLLTNTFDSATYYMTPEQFQRIAFASSLEFRVNGANGSATFPRSSTSLLDSFQQNLRQFYSEQIAPHL